MNKKIKYLLMFIGLLLLEILYSSIVVLILEAIGLDIKSLNEPIKSIVLILIEISLMVIIYFIFRKEINKEIIDYKNNFGNYLVFGVITWVIGLLLMIVSNVIIMMIYPSQAVNEEAVQEILKEAPIYATFAACIFAPFVEEIVFRKALHKIIPNKTLFIIVSGLLFGLAHNLTSFGSMQMLYIIPYGLFGCVFAYAYAKTENIFVPMVFHFVHNTLLVTLSLITLGVL